MCFILRLSPCFVDTARAVLLFALACIRNDSPISFNMACAKIDSADSAPRAYISDSPLNKATVPCPRHSSREIDQRNKRFSSRVPFKYLNTFLARVKSARVGDASLYDKHFVANIKSGLTPVMYCRFPTTALNNEC